MVLYPEGKPVIPKIVKDYIEDGAELRLGPDLDGVDGFCATLYKDFDNIPVAEGYGDTIEEALADLAGDLL